MSEPGEDLRSTFEARLAESATAPYVLILFVAGASDLSRRAIGNIHALCEAQLSGRYTLDVVDVLRDHSSMSAHDLVAAPALIKVAPLPKRMLVGDLSDTARVSAALDLTGRSELAGSVPGE